MFLNQKSMGSNPAPSLFLENIERVKWSWPTIYFRPFWIGRPSLPDKRTHRGLRYVVRKLRADLTWLNRKDSLCQRKYPDLRSKFQHFNFKPSSTLGLLNNLLLWEKNFFIWLFATFKSLPLNSLWNSLDLFAVTKIFLFDFIQYFCIFCSLCLWRLWPSSCCQFWFL